MGITCINPCKEVPVFKSKKVPTVKVFYQIYSEPGLGPEPELEPKQEPKEVFSAPQNCEGLVSLAPDEYDKPTCEVQR